MKKTNFAVGGYRHCDKCGEEYHSGTHHTCEPTDADLEKLGNRAMEFLVAKYGYPQADKFVNWQARPEEIALEMADFAQRQLQKATKND